MLSEKAKGKQRATGPQSEPAPPEAPAPRTLVIRFTEGIPDLGVSVSPQDAVRDIKQNIRNALPDLKDRRLRLIHSGRLLTDGTFLYAWLTSLEERGVSSTTWMHCSVGPKMEKDDELDDNREQGIRPPASIGFSEIDIANFRRQFHSQSSSNYLDHARALEEQWIDSIDNAGSASLSQSSPTNSSLLQGILLGFFFPLIPFFFMRDTKPATFWEDGTESESTGNVIFGKRMQMGLVIGFIVNLLFGMWRMLLDAS
ncbi:hypothetical protein BD779DRAFT_1753030 [Infundibulicybe gibba]|nr:hypothetical protein BD779DRAFT_1753030 [Infundibulicybe gibba]